jgi:hypothetical protein
MDVIIFIIANILFLFYLIFVFYNYHLFVLRYKVQ